MRSNPWIRIIRVLAEVSFGLFVVLSLTTPSWRYGPFTWWPLWEYTLLAGAPVKLGVLNLLPALVVGSWLTMLVLERKARAAWSWGRLSITLPLLGLTILGLLSLNTGMMRRTFIHGGELAITWLVYLYIINERPRLTLPLSVIVLAQGGVAIAQFILQRDLGLVALGELPLNPMFEGVTVLFARGQYWLRAYGLTAHPNLLGALLATLLLLLLPVYSRQRGWRQLGLMLIISVGAVGLLVSFSRAAWLGFGAGVLVWAILSGRLSALFHRPQRNNETSPVAHRPSPLARRLLLLLPLLPLLLLLWLNLDLVLSRVVALDNTPTEAQSVDQRVEEIQTALKVIGQYPLTGVGLGNYVYAALYFDPDARRVHNVPLFVAAELGLVGGLLWLWLVVAPFWNLKQRGVPHLSPHAPRSAAQLAPWAAMIVMSMFDTMLWWSSNWQTAILFALLVAHLIRDVTYTTSVHS